MKCCDICLCQDVYGKKEWMSVLGDLMYLLNTEAKPSAVLNVYV